MDAELAKRRVEVGRNVVVVEVKASLRDSRSPGDGVEFLERGVTDEVTPDAAVTGPQGRIDEDCHSPTLRRS
jgi:hypothetical protein